MLRRRRMSTAFKAKVALASIEATRTPHRTRATDSTSIPRVGAAVIHGVTLR
jgi:hypothetical protein